MPDSPFRLDGKVALVTGAGRGLGRGIAIALAAAGAEILLNSRSPQELDAVAAEIAAAGGKARPLPFDVTDPAAMRAGFAGLERLDILVNNAGVNRPQPFLEVDEETLDRLIALNVRALFLTAQAGARLMTAQQSGVIINMSSQMGHVGSERDRTVYVMTKHALEGLTKSDGGRVGAEGRAGRVDRPDLYQDAADRAVLPRAELQQVGARSHPARPARHDRRGGRCGGVSRLARRRSCDRFVATGRRRLDRVVKRRYPAAR